MVTVLRTNRALVTRPDTLTGWNPGGGTGTNSIESGGGVTGVSSWIKRTLTATGTATYITVWGDSPGVTRYAVTPGEAITASASVIHSATPGTRVSVILGWRDAGGALLSQVIPVEAPGENGTWYRRSVTAVVPAGAATVSIGVGFGVITGWAIGEYVGATEFLLETEASSLAKWRAALSTAGSSTANVLAIGDSITEGQNASDASLRWVNVLQDALRPGGAEFPFIPAYPMQGGVNNGIPVVRSGSWRNSHALSQRWGLGWKTVELYADDGLVEFSFSGTSCAVVFSRGSSTGVMSVSIDGGAETLVNTNSAASSNSNGTAWSSPALTDGPHTVRVRRSATSTAGQSVWLQGLVTYQGDATSGVRVMEAARRATNSSYPTVDTSRLPWMVTTGGVPGSLDGTIGGAANLDLLVYAYGTNDYSAGTPLPSFKANVEAVISGLRAGGFSGSVLLVGMYMGQGRDLATWQGYLNQLAAVASEDPDVAFLNLRDHMPDVPTPYNDPSGQGLFADTLHPNDGGHARIAQVIAAALTESASFFDGATSDRVLSNDGAALIYDWTGAANASTSTESLTDAVITAELITSAGSPPPVQVVLNGIPNGAEYVVTGSTGAGSSWPVPGGTGVGDGGQIVLVDNRSALNTPVTYSVVVQGVTYSADPVTVAHDGQAVLQSLDGGISVDFVWLSNSLPREPQINTVAFNVPGRRRPPMRYAPGGDGGGELLIRADRENNAAIGALLQSGRPILVRTDGTMRDWPAVELITLVSAPSRLWEAVENGQLSTQRVWSLGFLFSDDPEPSRVLSAWTWDDFDLAAETSFDTWDDFDALFAGQTWDDFDTTDWGQYQ